jgi:isopenicillin-N epimerase
MRDFLYTGTRDYTPFAALEATLDFRTSLGGDEPIYNHMANQARQGAAELQSLWGTRLSAPANMSDAMLTVELPACLGQQAAGLMTGLAQEHNIQV